jgi:predicted DNA-binding transcriptional regulator YafY
LEITNEHFEFPKNFNIEETFRYCFGIIGANGEAPQDIILSFNAEQGKYIKTLPLHHTQEILKDTNEELQIKLRLCITHDLIMELLSYSDEMKVLQPKILADKIKRMHQNACKQYS